MEVSKTPKFINDLISYLIGIKNLSAIYVNNMRVTIEQFLDFINIHKLKNKYSTIKEFTLNDLRSITNSDIYSFIYFLAENHYKLNSRVVKTEHLRTFFDYLFTIKHTIFTEPFKKIKCERKVEQKLPNYLSLEEAQKVLVAYNNNVQKNYERDIAILNLFFKEKMKIFEIVDLNINDVNKLNNSTKNIIKKYLELRKEMNINNNALFISNYNERISRTNIIRIIKEIYLLQYENKDFKIKEIQENLSEDEINILIDTYYKKCRITDIRNNAILHLFLNCGLRLSEVSNLDIKDINLEENKLSIIGKGNKERTGYLNAKTRAALEEYLNLRKEINVKTDALFLSIRNKRISNTSIKRIVQIAYLLSNLEDKQYSAHTLRHTCATLLYRAGINIKTIQALLGHVQIDTTEIYTHLHNEEVRTAMLGHPLSKFKLSNALAFSM